MRMSLLNLTPEQLRMAARLKERVMSLETRLEKLLTGTVIGRSPGVRAIHRVHRRRRSMSKAARAKIGAAARARWAKVKAAKG